MARWFFISLPLGTLAACDVPEPKPEQQAARALQQAPNKLIKDD